MEEAGGGDAVLARVRAMIAARRGPHVTLAFAQSLDGSISLGRGRPVAISSEASFRLTHALRGMHSAILVGIGTALSDNPSLTTRLAAGSDPQPIVLDSALRLPLDCKLLTDARCRLKPVLVCRPSALLEHAARASALEAAGARLLPVGSDDLGAVLAALGREWGSIMVEGGASVITSLLLSRASATVSCVVITVAPAFLGGLNAVQRQVPEALRRQWRMSLCKVVGGDPTLVLEPQEEAGAAEAEGA